MNEILNIELAMQEIERWLDYKKVSPRKREANKDSIDILADAVSTGNLVLKEDCTLVQTLNFPISSEKKTEVLEFKPRLQMKSVYQHLQGVKPSDIDARLYAYAAALTGNPKELIKNLETSDYEVVSAIVVFFI